ncbi:MAG: NAD-dependent epimerase/dehydratase family protein [Candidatus Nanoarchaeia archaeon]|nr:NAD-dependent epimerase/dehydratase family protein [Candidatus Nanoarchaeia archaeon]
MKILVTGGAGFIGSHVVDLLIENEQEVFVIDNLSSGRLENLNPKARFFKQDLCDYETIEKIIGENRPEIVYHLAAQIDVRKSVENPVFDTQNNVLATINLLELCKKYKIKHFIFSSTGGAIYGDAKEIPTAENYAEKPICPYGCAKLSIEKYLHYYNFVHGLKYTALRYGNVYGPRQNPHGEAGVVAIFINNMLNGKNPVIFGGRQTRDFVFVEDVAKANLLALNDNKSDIYNVGTGVETDIDNLFLKLNKLFDNKFQAAHMEMKKGEQLKSCISFNKIRENLGWMPSWNIEDGLKKTYLSFK